ncbi:hypothetical protein I5M32_10880 [Pedobacter sp. SD-b]|uniref:Uncharacterized protein n=1 Tax=Pedobacter segetis TaxID=2793069 RepID=A0ABS1BKN9_9SPHI|nr:hypothetical protein [Pedobacter segetis]MBK0383463.1 hypothetical protein [Pedobacter segetis]
MKSVFILFVFFATAINLLAQQKTYNIVTYTAPNGWTEKAGKGNISYSNIDGGTWAQIVIYKSMASSGNIAADFDKDWNELVAANKTISLPEKTSPKTTEGWMVISGSGTWSYNGAKVTSQLTVYSNGQVSISVLCNSTNKSFLNDYQALLSSMVLNAEKAQLGSDTKNKAEVDGLPAAIHDNSIVGIWIVNQAESNGFINGHLMYTGGYMRKEYQFNDDGTYVFSEKNWLAVKETIYFVYETGTWVMNGNQLTITPKKGEAGWWLKDKVTNDVNKWGIFQEASNYKLQTATYMLEIKIDPNYSNSIILNSKKATQRDGGQLNNPPYRFVYVQRKETLIDNPPGFKL